MSAGFALRHNGSCAGDDIVDCGGTTAGYHACCPAEAPFCPHQYNVDCCPTSDNCTATLVKQPKCANESWNLYDNGGYFCCEMGLKGYASTSDSSDGCALPGHEFTSGQLRLDIISSGKVSSTSASSTKTSSASSSATTTPTSRTSSSTATSTSAASAKSHSSSTTGPIVGGVVGGVAFLVLVAVAFWLWRRRQNAKTAETEPVLPQQQHQPPPWPLEKYSIAIPSEMEGRSNVERPPAEMDGTRTYYGPSNQPPIELHG